MPSIPITDSMIFEEQPKDKKKSSKDKKQTSDAAAMEITTSTDKKKSKEKKSPKVEEPSSDDSAQLKKSKKKRSAEETETETETELVGESVKKQKLLENGEVVAAPAVKEDPNATSRFRISKPLREKLKANGIEALFPIQAMTFDTILMEVVDREGKSSLLSLVKAFDSVLEVYEGFCNLKQLASCSFGTKFVKNACIELIKNLEAKDYGSAIRSIHMLNHAVSVTRPRLEALLQVERSIHGGAEERPQLQANLPPRGPSTSGNRNCAPSSSHNRISAAEERPQLQANPPPRGPSTSSSRSNIPSGSNTMISAAERPQLQANPPLHGPSTSRNRSNIPSSSNIMISAAEEHPQLQLIEEAGTS